MLLLLRSRLVVSENLVNHGNKCIKLRLRRRFLAHVYRRHRELHHLAHGPRINPKPTSRRTLAQPFNPNRMPNLQIDFHVLHPPPSAQRKGLSAAGVLLRRNRCPAASVRDNCSGAYTFTQFDCGSHVSIRSVGSLLRSETPYLLAFTLGNARSARPHRAT